VQSYHEGGGKSSPSPARSQEQPDFVKNSLDDFRQALATKVAIKASGNGKGKISIPFSSREDFQRLKKLITGD
jgi:ParB family chromosome partitioning protein